MWLASCWQGQSGCSFLNVRMSFHLSTFLKALKRSHRKWWVDMNSTALVLFSCLYLSFAYDIFYMFLVLYTFIYDDTCYLNTGQEGLTFLAIGVGAIACVMYFGWDAILRPAYARDSPWFRKVESRRLPLAYVAGPFFVISCFWVGWTARSDVDWIVSVRCTIWDRVFIVVYSIVELSCWCSEQTDSSISDMERKKDLWCSSTKSLQRSPWPLLHARGQFSVQSYVLQRHRCMRI